MSEDKIKDFLDLNIFIFRKLKDKFSRGKIIIKKGYAKYSVSRYGKYHIVLYATKEYMLIQTAVTCLPFDNDMSELLSFKYSDENDIKKWSEKEIRAYIDKTYAFLEEVIILGDNTEYCFETYSWDYDWQSIIFDFVKEHDIELNYQDKNILWSEYTTKILNAGSYSINGFVCYATEYSNKRRLYYHTLFLKKLNNLLSANSSKKDKYFSKHYIGLDKKEIEDARQIMLSQPMPCI